jgi:uncharacterized protein (TIGR02118 family)
MVYPRGYNQFGRRAMHKLLILIEPSINWQTFEELWPDFLHLAESMPGLRREATSRIDTTLFGNYPVTFIHELYFDSLDDASQALSSPEGRAAGKLLQEMTQGRVNLFFADHKEDALENILKFKRSAQPDE